MYPDKTRGWKVGLGFGVGAVSSAPAGTVGMGVATGSADAFFFRLPAGPWVMKEPLSIKAEPIAWSTVNFSCKVTIANIMAKGTCNWTTGAVRFTPISWL